MADVVPLDGRQHRRVALTRHGGPPGSENTACTQGSFEEPERSSRLRRLGAVGAGENVQAFRESRSCSEGETNTERTTVPRNEGNEVKREGREEVGAAHSIEEAGELGPTGIRWRKGAVELRDLWRER